MLRKQANRRLMTSAQKLRRKKAAAQRAFRAKRSLSKKETEKPKEGEEKTLLQMLIAHVVENLRGKRVYSMAQI